MASNNPLADAAAKLKDAEKFDTSVTGKAPKKKATAAPAAPKPAPKAPTVMDELAAKKANIDQYDKNTPKYHNGGKIKKDGKQTIDAEKGETVLPTHDAKRVTELVMDHMKGMADAMKSEKKDKKEKVAPMNEAHHGTEHTKRSHSFKRTVIVHHKHGGHTTTHEHDEGPDKDVEYSSDHMDGVLDGLQSNAGEPNEGEPQADAGQHGVPEPMASDAGLPPAGPAQG